MKKKIWILIIIVIVIIIGILLLIPNKEDSKKGSGIEKDLTAIKQSIRGNKEYYIFEDNNEKYVLVKLEVSTYSPDEIKIKTFKVKNKSYNTENQLELSIDIEKEIIDKDVPAGMSIDGINKDFRYLITKVKKDCTGVIVNNEQYVEYKEK